MSISLSDIPAAVADYIKNNVTVAVSAVKHSGSTVLQPHEKAAYTVTVTNNGSVGLTDLVFELSIAPASVAKLLARSNGLTASSFKHLDLSGGVIADGTEVDNMFLVPIPGIANFAAVDPRSSVTTPELQVQTKALGGATITCFIHATVDQATLFPAEQQGKKVTSDFTVQ